jgi:hypothetical protein
LKVACYCYIRVKWIAMDDDFQEIFPSKNVRWWCVFSEQDESQQSKARRNLPFQGFKIDLEGQEQMPIREGWVRIENGLQTQLKTNFCAYKL